MPSENVAIVRRGFDAFESKDMDAFVADWDPEVGILYTLRDRRVRRMEVYTGHERARRAAASS